MRRNDVRLPKDGAVSIRQADSGHWYICVYRRFMQERGGRWHQLPPFYNTRSAARQVVKDSRRLQELIQQ